MTVDCGSKLPWLPDLLSVVRYMGGLLGLQVLTHPHIALPSTSCLGALFGDLQVYIYIVI